MSYNYAEKLDHVARERYDRKIAGVGLEACPYKLHASSWADNATAWPDVQYPDIYGYLIDTPGVYTKDSMKNWKSLEAYNQFQSGWVGKVLHHKTSTGAMIMKADVRPSQRVNDQPHHPWVAVKGSGTIISAHCDCMAGLGESCSHIGAILFKVEAAVRLGYTRKACTDVPCRWNNDFVQKVQPAKVANIDFRKKEKTSSEHKKAKVSVVSTQEEQTQFLDLLKQLPRNDQPVGLSLFQKYSEKYHSTKPVPAVVSLPPSLRSYFIPAASTQEIDNQIDRIMNIQLTSEQVEYIEKTTVNQSQSPEWKDLRTGRITASIAHDVLHTNQNTPAKSLITRICTPSLHELRVPAIQWGKANEEKAINVYRSSLQKQHVNVTINKTGLRLLQDGHFLGASPDAVGKCDCHGHFTVEVKCPYSKREAANITDLLGKDSCLGDNMLLKKEHKYMTQLQMQMFVLDVQFAHFVLWTPKICFGQVVQRQEHFEHSVSTLKVFFKNHIARELVTRSLENKDMPSTSQDKQDVAAAAASTSALCFCKQPYTGEDMVGCDNNDCPYQWIHFKCAGLKHAPKGTWYCKECRKASRTKTN